MMARPRLMTPACPILSGHQLSIVRFHLSFIAMLQPTILASLLGTPSMFASCQIDFYQSGWSERTFPVWIILWDSKDGSHILTFIVLFHVPCWVPPLRQNMHKQLLLFIFLHVRFLAAFAGFSATDETLWPSVFFWSSPVKKTSERE